MSSRKSETERLKAQVAELRAKATADAQALAEVEKVANQWRDAHAALKAPLKEERDENARLRDELHAAALRIAELQGYIKALADSEPPAMVPAHPHRHVAGLLGGGRPSSDYDSMARYGREPEPNWWNRGRPSK